VAEACGWDQLPAEAFPPQRRKEQNMWQNLTILGRAAAFPLAFVIIVLGVEARTDMRAPAAPIQVATQPPLDLTATRASWQRDHGVAPDRLTIALR
jgi:hypothetical protein